MDYDNCSPESSSIPEEIKRNNSCQAYGGDQSDVYDWLRDIVMPTDCEVCNIIEIKFNGFRKEFYLNHQSLDFKNGEFVVVEGNKGGYDVGRVSSTGELVRLQLKKKSVRKEDVVKKIYRRATSDDVTKWKLTEEMGLDALHKARVLVKGLNLSMKLTEVDYQGDKSKATFYYTAAGRIDFRELIKHLAETFHIHVEMRQIGTREEYSRIGTIGPCGSYICCHTWSTNFRTDSPFVRRYKKYNKLKDNKYECYIEDEAKNREGINPLSVGSGNLNKKEYENSKSIVAKALFYENDIDQDSITRFDKKNNKHKNRKRKRNNKFNSVKK